MELYLIRHGETKWNDEKRLQGQCDIPLTENGIRMAQITGEALSATPFDLCYASPLSRALETARQVLQGRDVPILPDDRLKEINFGPWEGRQVTSLPPEFLNFKDAPDRYVSPMGAESLQHLCTRAADFVNGVIYPAAEHADAAVPKEDVSIASHVSSLPPDIGDAHCHRILVVSHGALGQALKLVLEGKPLSDFWKPEFPANCSVTTYEIQDGRARLLGDNQIFYDPEQFRTPKLI